MNISTKHSNKIETPQPWLLHGASRGYSTADEIRNKKERRKNMELIVEKKSVYGNQLIYPVCNKAKLFASISGNKTLLPEVIEDIKKLGYKLTTKGEQI
jgi:hypothetical protein